ncbi:MAG: PAS domain S-box protein, partial [Deltaproteobacteria bacterium]|nr:PAS domain S-box protein [Deltaproteobacteria bacterium]
ELEFIGGGQEVAELTGAFNRKLVDKKRAEEALRESEVRYRSLYSSTNEGIALHEIIYDESGEPVDYRILDVNPAFKFIVGIKRDDAIGAKASELYGTGEAPYLEIYAKVASSGEPTTFETTFEPLAKSFKISAFSPTKGNFATLFSDITERKRAEEKLKGYAEALEEARNDLEQKVEERTRELKEAHEALVRKERLAVLGQLSSGVGHELRNPLGVIKNACYFLNMKMETIQDEAVKDNIRIMNREINTANKIITDLLDFARIKEPMRQDTDINQLVAATLSKSLIPDNITISSNFPEDMATVSIDPIQVGQIFLNLIENAVHAMGESGTLKISTRETGGATEVVFDDDGCGIPKENMEKIFEPLFTTKAKGIGLGLSVSKSLAEANGASILVESEEGKGSRFVVRFRD